MDIGLIRGQLAGITDENTRRVLITVFEYLSGNLTFGEPAVQTRAKNFQSYFQGGTTPSTGATDFSVMHGLAQAPHLAIPVLDLTQAGGQFVPMTVTRSADKSRLYLSSPSTRATFALLVE